ncbi:MAG TPA: ABC transporter ATP-binding protein [Chitinophagaceae bacterium]|nr:ABC transporter ATP-binding protein [Chitinophagaceae bacterium]
MAIAIKVENLSKAYRLGLIGTGTLGSDLKRWYALARGKEDPFLKIGETNDRTTKSESNVVWSLKDINFEIEQGDAVGIIGKNGAGKSTLLKILSRVTGPTSGKITGNGRVASLLEVGTGFHPELTGKDNIYLNGAILGMRKKEIKRKFDEIVDFAGVERYIDTPVKRYSSGMYVRLAFAVAAHLESEILIVDEVLAVGDTEFQKRCLGKMGEVSKGEGRTVLFVSHNLSAVETLCRKGMYLKNGKLLFYGASGKAVTNYLQNEQSGTNKIEFKSIKDALGNDKIKILSASAINAVNPDEVIEVSDAVNLSFQIVNLTNDPALSIGFDLQTLKGETVFGSGGMYNFPVNTPVSACCSIPGNFLNDGSYTIYFYVHNKNVSALLIEFKDLIQFDVKDSLRENAYLGKINGFVRPKLEWEIKIDEEAFNYSV